MLPLEARYVAIWLVFSHKLSFLWAEIVYSVTTMEVFTCVFISNTLN